MKDFFSRLASGASNVVQRAGQNLMPEPEEGLMSKADIARARQQGLLHLGMSMLGDTSGDGLGPAISRGLGAAQTGYQGATQQRLGQQDLVTQRQEQLRQKQMLVTRAEIGRKYPASPSDTPDQQVKKMRQMYMDYVSVGDTEMAGKLSEVIKSLEMQKPHNAQEVDLGDRIMLRMPDGTERVIQKGAVPKDPNAFNPGADAAIQRRYMREQGLADDFNRDTRDTREMANTVAGAIAEAPAARRGDGIAQVNMLYAFVKAMDPTSAVREGELALVRSAGSLVQQANNYIGYYTQGKARTVPPGMVNQMEQLMRRRLAGSQRYVKSRAEYYQKRGAAWGVDPASFPALDGPPPAAEGERNAAAQPAPSRVVRFLGRR